MWLSDLQKIGVALVAGGIVAFLLGIVSFFDARLLSFGNLLFVGGVVLLLGVPRTARYVTAPRKRRGSICFTIGVVLVLRRRTYIGFFLELFGIANLFADFSGVIVAFLRQMPVVGNVLSHPSIAPYVDRLASGNILPV